MLPEQLFYKQTAADTFFRTEVDRILQCRPLILFEEESPYITLVNLKLVFSCLGLLSAGIIDMGHQQLQIIGEPSMVVEDRERRMASWRSAY